jgi:2-polyprenyl-6-methoxyphenol hydroxylase-like FAD-dependent oxidoreductase
LNTLIVGGGIGGLATAITLSQAGYQVTLVEKAARFDPIGAGIVVAPNAAQILAALGVDLFARGQALTTLDLTDADGTLLQRIDTQRYVPEFGPTFGLLRSGLHEALLDAVPNDVEIIHGSTVSEVTDTGDAVEVTFGSAAGRRRFDVVVGADGLNSTVRTLLYGPQELRYSGVTCWRGLAKNPGYTQAVEAWGGATRIGVVPLPDERIYYFLVMSAPPRAPQPSWPDGFHRAFGHHKGELAEFFEALHEAPPLHHDLDELDSPLWGRSRVFLLGDAAHAMTPNQGQGAAMAVEDAIALKQALRDGIGGALERYAALRHRRVRTVQMASRRIGSVAHWRSPLARAVRNGLMRRLPASVGDKQYRGIVEPGLALLRDAETAAPGR